MWLFIFGLFDGGVLLDMAAGLLLLLLVLVAFTGTYTSLVPCSFLTGVNFCFGWGGASSDIEVSVSSADDDPDPDLDPDPEVLLSPESSLPLPPLRLWLPLEEEEEYSSGEIDLFSFFTFLVGVRPLGLLVVAGV